MKLIVTTGRKSRESDLKLAIDSAQKLSIDFRPRSDDSFEKIFRDSKVDGILVVNQNSIRLQTPHDEFFFHPSLAHVRIKNLREGRGDRMIDAMKLKSGMSVLDCTLGLGADSIVASFVSQTQVVGIESSPAIALIVEHGFQNFSDESPAIIESMRRIKVINANHKQYLKTLKPKSFDVIYFDPMFRHPITKSQSIGTFRSFANPDPLDLETIELAKSIARDRIIMKENSRSLEFARLGFQILSGGKYSSVAYGAIEL